jgi:uncharacterized protein YaiI (UPF0178 family)
MDIYSDAHKVLPLVLRLGERHALEVYVVTRDYLDVDGNVHLILVEDQQVNRGAWVTDHILRGDICVTGDPELAAGCILKGVTALTPLGRDWLSDARGDDARSFNDNPGERWAPDTRSFANRFEQAIAGARDADRRRFGGPRRVAASDLARVTLPRVAHG